LVEHCLRDTPSQPYPFVITDEKRAITGAFHDAVLCVGDGDRQSHVGMAKAIIPAAARDTASGQ